MSSSAGRPGQHHGRRCCCIAGCTGVHGPVCNRLAGRIRLAVCGLRSRRALWALFAHDLGAGHRSPPRHLRDFGASASRNLSLSLRNLVGSLGRSTWGVAGLVDGHDAAASDADSASGSCCSTGLRAAAAGPAPRRLIVLAADGGQRPPDWAPWSSVRASASARALSSTTGRQADAQHAVRRLRAVRRRRIRSRCRTCNRSGSTSTTLSKARWPMRNEIDVALRSARRTTRPRAKCTGSIRQLRPGLGMRHPLLPAVPRSSSDLRVGLTWNDDRQGLNATGHRVQLNRSRS